MTTPEQQARDMLELMGADELIEELANLIAERDALKAELAAIKRGAGEPVAWALIDNNGNPYRATHDRRSAEAYELHGINVQPLYTRPCVPLTDERASDLGSEMVKGGKSVEWLVREVERAHNIKGAKG